MWLRWTRKLLGWLLLRRRYKIYIAHDEVSDHHRMVLNAQTYKWDWVG